MEYVETNHKQGETAHLQCLDGRVIVGAYRSAFKHNDEIYYVFDVASGAAVRSEEEITWGADMQDDDRSA